MKHIIYTSVLVVFTMLTTYAQKSEIFAPAGKAIKGYDAVAFFRESKPVMGQDSLSYTWKDATWLFSSRKNMEDFKSNPEKYAPQYGGYCAYGTSQGHKSPTETDTWTIVNEKLYFNYNKKVQTIWLKDEKALIEKADQQWSDIKNKE